MPENGRRKGSSMNIEIAQRLYELRRKHGFSQESLAAKLGLSRQAISKWERSESAPDMGNLIALADLYGMTIDELIRPAVEDDVEDEAADKVAAIAHDAADDAADGIVDDVVDAAEEDTEVAGELIGESSDEAAAELVGETTDDAVVENIEIDDEPWVDDATNAEAERLATDGVDQVVLTSSANPTTASISAVTPPAPDVKQVSAHGHIFMRPPAQTAPRCKLRSFPYPLLVTVIFLVLALVFSLWEYVWLFLTIPFYYWIARIIERDPDFLAEHGYELDNTAQQPVVPPCAAEAKEVR